MNGRIFGRTILMVSLPIEIAVQRQITETNTGGYLSFFLVRFHAHTLSECCACLSAQIA